MSDAADEADADVLIAAIRLAWDAVPVPPLDDLRLMVWSSGEEAWRTFAGIAPMAVDVSSPGFLGCTPLLELPPRAAAAYLGTYLVSLVEGIEFQRDKLVFYDLVTRAHLLACLEDSFFWARVIRPVLPVECRQVLAVFVSYLGSVRKLLALTDAQLRTMTELAAQELPSTP